MSDKKSVVKRSEGLDFKIVQLRYLKEKERVSVSKVRWEKNRGNPAELETIQTFVGGGERK